MKRAISFVVAAVIALAATACSSGSPESSAPSSSAAPSSAPVSSAVSSAASSSSKVVTEADKKSAIEKDRKIMDIVTKSEKTTKLLQQACGEVGSGNGNTLELYNVAKEASSSQLTYFSSLSDLHDDSCKDYISSCQSYVSNARLVAKDLMKYLDKGKMKYLSEAQDFLKNSESRVMDVVTERTKYLSSQGLSDSEVADILSASASSTSSK